MLIPDLNFLMNQCGIDIRDIVISMAAKGDFPGGPSARTLAKIKGSKAEARPSTLQKLRNGYANFVLRMGGPTAEKGAEFIRNLSLDDWHSYTSPWESLCDGVELSAGGPVLRTSEIKRLLELSIDLRDRYRQGGRQAMAVGLVSMDIPDKQLARLVAERLKTMNDDSIEALGAALTPLMLSNVLYLLICEELDSDRVNRLQPLYGQEKTISPLVRWLDAIREERGLTNDEQLGQCFYPSQSEARREMKKWRAGGMPSWAVIRRVAYAMPEDRKANLYMNFLCVRLFDALEVMGKAVEDHVPGFSRRALFESITELQQYAGRKRSDIPEICV